MCRNNIIDPGDRGNPGWYLYLKARLRHLAFVFCIAPAAWQSGVVYDGNLLEWDWPYPNMSRVLSITSFHSVYRHNGMFLTATTTRNIKGEEVLHVTKVGDGSVF
ncbi:uncharacterized protein LOC144141389 [Haemaphysalis longicornis]